MTGEPALFPRLVRVSEENWAAYVDKEGFGLAAYVPVAERLTCYRFGDGRRDTFWERLVGVRSTHARTATCSPCRPGARVHGR